MAEDAKKPGQVPGKLPDKSTNEHVSAGARMAEASKGSVAGTSQKQVDAQQEAAEAGQKLSDAAQKAAPTGKNIPEIAAENIKGQQTAISKPHQPTELRASGAQLEPALIAKDGGSIPHGMVSSPTGLIPASATSDPVAALAKYEASVKRSLHDAELSEETLSAMNKHEIRAVAHDRGYRIGEGSQRALKSRFLEAQAAARTKK
jgi:hypothetical protein